MFKESLGDFWIDFILVNLVYLTALAHRRKIGGPLAGLGWILSLAFCLFAFWDTDYFSFRNWFIRYNGHDSFRDMLYPVLYPFAFGNYTLFRFYIWGAALLLYSKTARRFEINANTALFVFAFFFLMTFSYARASLGMAFYFWGLSYLLVKKGSNNIRYILCAIGFFMAFAAHRSMIVPILMTPCMYIPLNKRNVIIALCALPVLSGCMHYVFEYLASNGSESDSLQEVYSSAQGYSNFKMNVTFNWKYMLTTQLRNWSFYAAMAFTVYGCLKAMRRKSKIQVSASTKRLTAYTFCLMYFATLFFTSGGGSNWGYFVMGYRFLYTTGIPLCLLLALTYKQGTISKRLYYIPLIMYFIYSEGYLIGKIAALGVV